MLALDLVGIQLELVGLVLLSLYFIYITSAFRAISTERTLYSRDGGTRVASFATCDLLDLAWLRPPKYFRSI